MGASRKPRFSPSFALPVVVLLASCSVEAATQPVDLDALAANAAESLCSTNVLSPFPVRIENKVTNRTNGDAFTFDWPSAGPGGFRSSVTAGTTNGVGATWVWTTDQSIVGFTGSSCPTDACFAQTSGPDPISGFCSDACLADGTTVTVRKSGTGSVDLSWTGGTGTFTVYRGATKIGVVAPTNSVGTTNLFVFTDTPPANANAFYVVRGTDCTSRKACSTNNDCSAPTEGTCVSRGPFGVPGRSLLASDVTVSAASLTSSLITFFSPPKEVFRATATTGAGGIAETLTNFSTQPISVTIPAFPPGCCPPNSDHPHQIRCGDECIDYLTDPNNCGACGNVCGDGTCCSNGACLSVCGEGQTFCDGECVFLGTDNENCGACGNACGEDGCCSGGTCHSLCGEGDLLCGDSCVDPSNDDNNCGACFNECGFGSCCTESSCVSVCEPGWTYCGENTCAELKSDNDNCGACGNACGEGSCCSEGTCVSVCGEGRTYCHGECVDLNFDSANCGSCGNGCGVEGCCAGGECTYYDCPEQIPPVGPSCPYLTEPEGAFCPGDTEAGVPASPSFCPDAPTGEIFTCPESPFPAPPVDEAPVCLTAETTSVIPPGGSQTTCAAGGPLFKEFPTAIVVCGDGIPGADGSCNGATTHVTTGTFNRLMPHPTLVAGNAFVTPLAIRVVSETSGDGNLEPGESGGLLVEVMNAGSMGINGMTGTLIAPGVDLTNDGVSNPVGLTIGAAAAAFGNLPGLPLGADCTAPKPISASNATVFPVTVPPTHPGDTSHPLVLTVHGTVAGNPFSMNVPLSLGIADNCDPLSGSGDFDGLDGLLTPMAKLVPEGDPVPFPNKVFNGGDNRPLKLRVGCGGVNVTNTMIDPPQIIGISEATRGPIDITFLGLNADTPSASKDFFFMENDVLSGPHWQYNLNTEPLGTGTFTLTIKIGGRKNYVTGFVLR